VKTLSLIPLLGSLLVVSPVWATDGGGTDSWDGQYAEKAERRSDFALGIDYGVGFGKVAGYPMDAVTLGDSRYRADTGLGVGQLGRLWLGGALTDWYTFGLGLELLKVSGNDLTARGGAFLLHNEIFPLWSLGSGYRDLGVSLNFGIGGMLVRQSGSVVADGGSLALVGLGVFHETLRWHGLAFGPAVSFSEYFSQTLDAHLGSVGLRLAYTTGP
jgi:hypothetical protein